MVLRFGREITVAVFVFISLGSLTTGVYAQDSAAGRLPDRWDLQTCIDYAKKNNLISIGNIVDERGNQLPKVVYENLNEAELMDWVERFYGEYYFRTRVIWRMVRKVIFNSHDRKRLTKEAREYMALRARRKKFISEQRQQTAISANAGD